MVSTLYAYSLERQLVSRRSQILQNISRSCSAEPLTSQNTQSSNQEQDLLQQNLSSQAERHRSVPDVRAFVDELFLSEAGIIPPELRDESYSGQFPSLLNNNNHPSDNNNSQNRVNASGISSSCEVSKCPTTGLEVDSKEFTDRLCKLPSQCRGGYVLGSPRRHPPGMSPASSRLCQSATNLSVTNDLTSLLKNPSGSDNASCSDKKNTKKCKSKDKKEAKKLPSNFMYLGTWLTRQNSERLLEQVRSGDVLEFNIKFHHHWGIALVNKNKKSTLENVELIHLTKDKEDTQKAVKQTLAEYWTPGVTARINNSRDVHKPPMSAADVISTSLKTLAQPYRIWPNSEQLITHCRYGEGVRSRQLSDAARWGTLSKCVGLWLNLTSSRTSSPATSPAVRRKRTCSVNF